LFKRDFTMSESARGVLKGKTSAQVLEAARKWLHQHAGQGQPDLHDLVKSVQDQTGLKGKQLYQPLRAALTGDTRGPELIKVYPLLETEVVFERFDRGVALCST
jgi:nondiscriminating glutamyl-tRNA synthetase